MLELVQGMFCVEKETQESAFGGRPVAAEDRMPNRKAGPRYRADITAGSLKVTESRRIADLLLHKVDNDHWINAAVERNILQPRNPASAQRLPRLIRSRLATMAPPTWNLFRYGTL